MSEDITTYSDERAEACVRACEGIDTQRLAAMPRFAATLQLLDKVLEQEQRSAAMLARKDEVIARLVKAGEQCLARMSIYERSDLLQAIAKAKEAT